MAPTDLHSSTALPHCPDIPSAQQQDMTLSFKIFGRHGIKIAPCSSDVIYL